VLCLPAPLSCLRNRDVRPVVHNKSPYLSASRVRLTAVPLWPEKRYKQRTPPGCSSRATPVADSDSTPTTTFSREVGVASTNPGPTFLPDPQLVSKPDDDLIVLRTGGTRIFLSCKDPSVCLEDSSFPCLHAVTPVALASHSAALAAGDAHHSDSASQPAFEEHPDAPFQGGAVPTAPALPGQSTATVLVEGGCRSFDTEVPFPSDSTVTWRFSLFQGGIIAFSAH